MSDLNPAERLLTTKLEIGPETMFRNVEGEAVLLHLGDESYYGLNKVGTLMLEAMQTHGTVEASINDLLTKLEVDSETLKADMLEFVSTLTEKGMLVES